MGYQINSYYKSQYTGQQIENALTAFKNMAAEYSQNESYNVGDVVLYGNGLYVCTGSTSGAFDPTKWQQTTLAEIFANLGATYSDPNSNGNVVIGVDSTVGEKILRSLTFPGLTNRYYLPFAQYIRERLQNDPSTASFGIEIPDAEDAPLMSTVIKGKTVAQNQLVVDGGFTDATNWAATNATLSLSNNVARSTCTTAGLINIKPAASVKYIAGHVYYQRVYARTSTSAHAARLSTALSVTEPTTTSNSFVELEVIGSRSSDTTAAYPQVIMQNASVDDYIEAKWMVNFDLTARGFTAAEYASPSALKTAWFKKYGTPMPLFSPYDGGSLANVNGVYRLRGRNLWDEEWEAGDLNGTTGQPQTSSTYIRSKNFCKCKANESIYVRATDNTYVFWYDANQNFINHTSTAQNSVVESPSNAVYFKLTNKSVAYNYNITLNESDSSINGQYFPYYDGGEIDCSDAPLNGVGNAQDEKDFATGERTNRCGIIDLSTLTWTASSNNRVSSTGIASLVKRPPDANTAANIISALYPTYSTNDMVTDGIIGISINPTSGNIIARTGTGNDPTGYLIYELANPVISTETPQPVYTEYGYNVLEPVSGGVQSAEVDTIFYENIAGYIDKRLNGG